MTAVTGVDVVHHLAKDASVGRCVFQLIIADIVVYHFVQDDVFTLVLRQFSTRVDAEFEIIAFDFPQQCPLSFVHTLSHECLDVAQFYGQWWQCVVENESVETVKRLLYERNGGNHGVQYNKFSLHATLYCCRCLTASNNSMAVLTDTLSESSCPSIGMRMCLSAAMRHSCDSPLSSVPITIAVGLRMSVA